MAATQFNFSGVGIGDLISRGRLFVPPNQRSYAWEEQNTLELLQDVNAAIEEEGTEEYFLGTIVLVHEENSLPQIADGQQRIATVSMILARIRDKFTGLKRDARARGIDETFLRKIDLETEAVKSQIELNTEDNEFYVTRILKTPAELKGTPALAAKSISNRRLLRSSNAIDKYFDKVLSTHTPENGANVLLRWVKFLRTKVSVVLVTVADEEGAYRIFETLNDRGLRASQSDILKNYFLSRAGNRAKEAHALWTSMTGAIDTIAGDRDDHTIRYVRHVWITEYGPVRQKDVAKTIKKNIAGELKSMEMVHKLSNWANDYVALWSPLNEKWTPYKSSVPQYLRTIVDVLKVEQIIPLLLAISLHFSPEEAEKAFRLTVSWSVRFLIVGGGRGGTVETKFGELAQKVGTKKITKARELREEMRGTVPTDAEFEQAFANARVAKTYLRRYYLRALDKTLQNDPEPEFLANEDETQINVEHIMPVTIGEEWDVDQDTADAAENLLGNMTLMRAKPNRDIGNLPFKDKQAIYAKSSYQITNQIPKNYNAWDMDAIKDRQAKMAKIALKTWTLDFKKPNGEPATAK